MSTLEKIADAYSDVGVAVHRLLTLPKARRRFRQMLRGWWFPTYGNAIRKHRGEISLMDKYVWLGTVHDVCFPDEAVFSDEPAIHGDSSGEITQTTAILSLLAPSAGNSPRPHRRRLNGFLADVEADLKAENGRGGPLRPCEEAAYWSYRHAVDNAPFPKKATDREIHSWLIEKGPDAYSDPNIPSFTAWSRYLRTARRYYGCPKNTPRAGRSPGRSIVRPGDIEPQGPKEK